MTIFRAHKSPGRVNILKRGHNEGTVRIGMATMTDFLNLYNFIQCECPLGVVM